MGLYGVFIGSKWGLERSKARALKAARNVKGYVIHVPWANAYGVPSSWDAPTFRVTGSMIADYREK